MLLSGCSLLFFHQVLLLGSSDRLPTYLSRQYIPALDVVVDPCAAILIFVVTMLLCLGIKEVVLSIVTFPSYFKETFFISPCWRFDISTLIN